MNYLERATLPHCLHLGLLRPRSVLGGVSVRCTGWKGATGGAAAAAVVGGRVSPELVLLRAGEGEGAAAIRARNRVLYFSCVLWN